ncbi:MAG TPA: TagF domain-containing protein, partial [Thermodesulfobacteriota bacterium]|nr:TagF domain-containing protein [Thermodesulfobacteriota bacterium]
MGANWEWAACGKHPAARDFFKLGRFSRLAEGIAQWVDRGYQLCAARKKLPENSWRFWTRGTRKGTLNCGVIRDCRDQVGRPYPFLTMGEGPLPGWEERWHFNIEACERSWAQMETLYTRNFRDLKEMEGEVRRILPPFFPETEPGAASGPLVWGRQELEQGMPGLIE